MDTRKKSVAMKEHRDPVKAKETQLSNNERDRVIRKHREATRKRVRKCRERKKSTKTQFNDSNEAIARSYSNFNSLCKAAKKMTRVLPVSPRKHKAVLAKIINDFDEKDRNELKKVYAVVRNEEIIRPKL